MKHKQDCLCLECTDKRLWTRACTENRLWAGAETKELRAALLRSWEESRTLLEALEESLALNINWSSDSEPESLAYFSEYRKVIAQAKAAIAKMKGQPPP